MNYIKVTVTRLKLSDLFSVRQSSGIQLGIEHRKANAQHSTNSTSCATQKHTQTHSLPVAAIKFDMVEGKPVYAIHLMGQKIPLAGITIPTPNGPMQLQSGTCSSTSNENDLVSVESSGDLQIPLTVTDKSSLGPSSPAFSVLSPCKFFMFINLHKNDVTSKSQNKSAPKL